jgi:hypothetical protein
MLLPKSGETIIIGKNFPADKIKLLDKYIAAHKNSSESQTIIPNVAQCQYHTETYWLLDYKFKPVAGKYLGIWTHRIDWTKLHNQYGFTNILVYGFGEVNSALNAGFNHDSINGLFRR